MKKQLFFGVPVSIILVILTFLPAMMTDAQSNSDDCGGSRFGTLWTTDFCNSSIEFDSVLSGGPPRDGIPAVDNPEMDTVEETREWLVDQSPVIAVEIDGEARAYPQAILMCMKSPMMKLQVCRLR